MPKSVWFIVALLAAWPAAARAQTPAQPGSAAPAAAPAVAPQRDPGLYMTFQTDKGNIACKLFEKESPLTVNTMVGLAIGKKSYQDPRTHQVTHKKFFDGLTFHRVIPGFMIQGGDPLGSGEGSPEGPGFPYKNESAPGLSFNVAGRLAMANAGPNTNGSQFFITEDSNSSLNGGYTIWGQCDNVDVVKAIARVPRDSNDKPRTPVHIVHVLVERVGPAPANAPEAMPVTPRPAAKPPVKPAVKPATPGTAPKTPAKAPAGATTGAPAKAPLKTN